jgi:hypothetical protein
MSRFSALFRFFRHPDDADDTLPPRPTEHDADTREKKTPPPQTGEDPAQGPAHYIPYPKR